MLRKYKTEFLDPTTNFVAQAKKFLPSTHTRLTALRSSLKDAPTTNENKRGKIIHDFWSSIWHNPHTTHKQKRKRIRKINKYLRTYTKRMRKHVDEPTQEHIGEAIDAVGRSSPGPDGIPFIAYKALKKFAIPMLYAKFKSAVRYDFGVGDYNATRLCLLAKTDTHLIDDTRPININNTDNRVIARAVVIVIADPIDEIVDDRQGMFIPGRDMCKFVRETKLSSFMSV